MKNVGLHSFGMSFVSQIILLIFGIATQSCLAWFLGPEGRGEYAVVWIYANILNLVFFFGCDIAGIYFVSSKEFNIHEGITYNFIFTAVGSTLAIIAGWIIIQFPFGFIEKASPRMFHLALVSIPLFSLDLILISLLTAINEFRWYAIFLSFDALLKLIFTVVFIKMLNLGAEGAILTIIVSSSLMILINLIWYHVKVRFHFIKPSFTKFVLMLKYGIRYYFGKLSNTINFQVGTIILAFFATKEEIGIFVVASQFASRIMIFPDSLMTVLIPKAAGDQSGRKELIAQCSRITLFLTIFLILIILIIHKPLILILFSPKFFEVAILFKILIAGIIIRSASKIFVPYFLGVNQPGIVSISTFTGTLCNIITLWCLLPLLGIKGAALAMVVGWTVGSLILFFQFKIRTGLPYSTIWKPQKEDILLLRAMVQRVYKKE